MLDSRELSDNGVACDRLGVHRISVWGGALSQTTGYSKGAPKKGVVYILGNY